MWGVVCSSLAIVISFVLIVLAFNSFRKYPFFSIYLFVLSLDGFVVGFINLMPNTILATVSYLFICLLISISPILVNSLFPDEGAALVHLKPLIIFETVVDAVFCIFSFISIITNNSYYEMAIYLFALANIVINFLVLNYSVKTIKASGYVYQIKIVSWSLVFSALNLVLFDVFAINRFSIYLSIFGVIIAFLFALLMYKAIHGRSLIDVNYLIKKVFINVLDAAIVVLSYALIQKIFEKINYKNCAVQVDAIGLFIIAFLIFLFVIFDRIFNRIFLSDRYKIESFIYDINHELTSSSNLRTLLTKSAKKIADIFYSKQAFFIVYKDNNSYISDGTDNFNHIPLRDCLELDKYMKKQASIRHFLPVTQFNAGDKKIELMLESYQIAIAAPLVVNNKKIIGYLFIGDKKKGYYKTRDLGIISTITLDASIAIENASSLQKVRELNESLQEKIIDATKQLRKDNEKLRQLDEAKDDFISMTSHQLRTPLTSIKGFISMILEGDAGKITPAQKELLSSAFASSERMVYLIGDFLNLSRIQTGRFLIEKKPVDLTKMVELEIDSLLISAKRRNLDFKFIHDDIPMLMLDEDKMEQVIMNFLDNALYYSKEYTTILVELRNDQQGNVVFTVKDHGIGVPDSEKGEIFNKFFRASNAKKHRPDGTGVGLYLTKQIINAHGGSVVFTSKKDIGSTFGFKLPTHYLKVSSK